MSPGQANVGPGLTNMIAIAGGLYHSVALQGSAEVEIVREPRSSWAYSGAPVLLSVGARSVHPVAFQWRYEGESIPGATQSTLWLPAVQHSQAGAYSVMVSNDLGVTISTDAQVSVMDQAPYVVSEPVDTTISSEGAACLQADIQGSRPLVYQWRKNGIPIQDATHATFCLSGLSRADSGLYSVAVSNAFGGVISRDASLRVIVPQLLRPPILQPAGTVLLEFGAADGAPLEPADMDAFEVRTSTNLVDWSLLTNSLVLTNGQGTVLDTDWTNFPKRFYRVIERP
ncbi:MAG TPA: immunoglobulin domain-containing protein [Bacillota bacterium]|nr:immunoglobulin domain-containing protein [Bacillota bacterium]